MTALVEVTGLVHGVSVPSDAPVEPILPAILRVPAGANVAIGDEVFVVVRAVVRGILPG